MDVCTKFCFTWNSDSVEYGLYSFRHVRGSHIFCENNMLCLFNANSVKLAFYEPLVDQWLYVAIGESKQSSKQWNLNIFFWFVSFIIDLLKLFLQYDARINLTVREFLERFSSTRLMLKYILATLCLISKNSMPVFSARKLSIFKNKIKSVMSSLGIRRLWNNNHNLYFESPCIILQQYINTTVSNWASLHHWWLYIVAGRFVQIWVNIN